MFLLIWDAVGWTVSLVVALWLRFEADLTSVELDGLALVIAVAIIAQFVVGTLLGMYEGRYCIGTSDDAINGTTTVVAVGMSVFIWNIFLTGAAVPRTVPVIASALALIFTLGSRLAIRRYREINVRPDRRTAERAMIIGAGPEGQRLVRAMLSDPAANYIPVALLDDDPAARQRRVSGVPVRGNVASLLDVARNCGATILIIALRSADAEMLRRLARTASDAGLMVKVLPSLSESLRPWTGISDLRDLNINDVLGRRPVDIDVATVSDNLTGKRVLVTGAGGSIGSELCRQINRFGPAELLMLDRDESALHATQLSLFGRALLDSPDVILADIRDAQTITDIFRDRRPEVVFHAAALKHLPMLEQYPDEAWKTNVLGTMNVLEAAQISGVGRFVNISTDKAANPTSVLGRSKRIGEKLVAHTSTLTEGTFVSVRFGNVLGSRGSVLTTFTDQLANGAPITVTHPDVTRYFMTIPEAVQLVIYAAAIGESGEALVLDMGVPVRILDVAHQLMDIAGKRAEIVFTGLREGEKLHEELFGISEVDRRPIHSSISHVDVPSLNPETVVIRAARHGPSAAMIDLTERPNLTGIPSQPTSPLELSRRAV